MLRQILVVHIAAGIVQLRSVCRDASTGQQRLIRPASRHPAVQVQVRREDDPIPPAHCLSDCIFHRPFLVWEEGSAKHHSHFAAADEPVWREGAGAGAGGNAIVVGIANGLCITGVRRDILEWPNCKYWNGSPMQHADSQQHGWNFSLNTHGNILLRTVLPT